MLLLNGFTGSPTFAPVIAKATNPVSSVVDPQRLLPSDRLHFGLSSAPLDIDWMITSGVPWKYRSQYLAGGVNTGTGWETWNLPAGIFARNYMEDSRTAAYIPVLTYYEILQSNPGLGLTEGEIDYNNLNNAATMNAYYANFKLLMEVAAAYGGKVVVHIEPDLWAYMQQRANGAGADSISAMVRSSGFAEVADLPDTVQGFSWALLRLRDLFAPNVTMAIHASMWSSGVDLASSTDPALDAVAVADATAAFLGSSGLSDNAYASTWDVVFNDVDDHNAGWWSSTGQTTATFTHWWDRNNVVFPNFSRYLAWVSELHLKSARQLVAWQVPEGNQYFLTENNTCGHYQDNVAEYFLAHPADLYSSGIVAVIFGSGNACQSDYRDLQLDGITNNGGVPTSDYQCDACNTNVSMYPDDDGGYLRLFVGDYYAKAWPVLTRK